MIRHSSISLAGKSSINIYLLIGATKTLCTSVSIIDYLSYIPKAKRAKLLITFY